MADAFERVGSDIEFSYNSLHQLLTMLAAVDSLGAVAAHKPSDSWRTKTAEANQRDLGALQRDLTVVAGGEQQLAAALHGIGWRLEAMQSAVTEHLSRIESELRIMNQQLGDMHSMIAKLVAEKDRETKRSTVAFANPDAAAFWTQHVAGIAGDNDRIAWANFAATVFSALSARGIDKVSWLAIEPALRRRFDVNNDGAITRAEYDAATSKPHPATVNEICLQLLLQAAAAAPPAAAPAAQKRGALARTTTVLSRETVQAALSPERAPVAAGPRYLPMTKRHAALVTLLTSEFQGDAKTRYAFMCVPRRLFAPEPLPVGISEDDIYANTPIKYGFWHQSQPTVYAGALRSMRIDDDLGAFSFLCVGSGSGYLNALVAVMQNWQGVNCGIELRADMVALARTRLDAFCRTVNVHNNIEIRHGNAFVSLDPSGGTFDRIYVAAGIAKRDLARLCAMLNVGGIMLAPVTVDERTGQQGLCVFEKDSDGKIASMNVMAVRYKLAIGAAAQHAHALAPFVNERERQCSNCHDSFAAGTKTYRCARGCDFALCGDCHAVSQTAAIVKWHS